MPVAGRRRTRPPCNVRTAIHTQRRRAPVPDIDECSLMIVRAPWPVAAVALCAGNCVSGAGRISGSQGLICGSCGGAQFTLPSLSYVDWIVSDSVLDSVRRNQYWNGCAVDGLWLVGRRVVGRCVVILRVDGRLVVSTSLLEDSLLVVRFRVVGFRVVGFRVDAAALAATTLMMTATVRSRCQTSDSWTCRASGARY